MDNNDITLEGSIATWQMSRVDGELGGTYTGTFQFRAFLSPTQQLQAGREYREYLGAHAGLASENDGNLAFALSQLKHRIIKAPPFWTSPMQDGGPAGNIGDLNVIALVLDAAIRSENIFKEKIQKERNLILESSISVAENIINKQGE